MGQEFLTHGVWDQERSPSRGRVKKASKGQEQEGGRKQKVIGRKVDIRRGHIWQQLSCVVRCSLVTIDHLNPVEAMPSVAVIPVEATPKVAVHSKRNSRKRPTDRHWASETSDK